MRSFSQRIWSAVFFVVLLLIFSQTKKTEHKRRHFKGNDIQLNNDENNGENLIKPLDVSWKFDPLFLDDNDNFKKLQEVKKTAKRSRRKASKNSNKKDRRFFLTKKHNRDRRSIKENKEFSTNDAIKVAEDKTTNLVKSLLQEFNRAETFQQVDERENNLNELLRQELLTTRTEPCNSLQKYREIDGRCNNLLNPEWGAAFTCMNRLKSPSYADDLSAPRKASSGNELPNPRQMSSEIHKEANVPSAKYTNMFMQWGQFLSQDLSQASKTAYPEEMVLGDSMATFDCCNPQEADSECFPISIPQSDPFYSTFGQTCLNFRRSAKCLKADDDVRQQINSVTSFIDGSQIYGSLLNTSYNMRRFQHGFLKTQMDIEGRALLSRSNDPANDKCSDIANEKYCFESGFSRVNQHLGLTTMYTLWVREHNRIATILRNLNPNWEDEQLYQEARRIVIAEMQVVTYNEYLRILLGHELYDYFELKTKSRGRHTHYHVDKDPSILNEFATAALRYGHSLVQKEFVLVDANLNVSSIRLKYNYFNPFKLYEGAFDSVLRGLTLQPSQSFDQYFVEDVTKYLYKNLVEPHGSDLVAINIQRGRDHGIKGYSSYSQMCNGLLLSSFDDFDTLMPITVRQKLQALFESVEDVDLFSGGVSEYPLSEAVVGPTFGCIIGNQFARIKQGDRFYFENVNEAGSFTKDQREELQKVTLAGIICANGDGIDTIQSRVFEPVDEKNPVTPCNTIKQPDWDEWEEDH
ncbi:salivary peroxidase/catechol oxidase-like isoform X2 [Tachypleus tridentatus]|uniref:salivary peroxidase/catechol oxidase-like isoform X2 n=1 Tax=Tachypleus tridentatus TaxID=6853 RepID=UPI003FD68F54